MSIFLKLIAAAFYVMIFQNLIFNGGYGISEAIRMSAKPRQLVPMAIFMAYFGAVVSTVCVLLDKIEFIHNLNELFHALLFMLSLAATYVVTMAIILIHGKITPRTVRRIGIAAFNTLVLAIPFINYRSAFSVVEGIGAGLGAGAAYIIAVLLINNGLKRLDMNKTIPPCFKGTPAVFIYTAILSLAFIGISGTSVFI